MTERASSGPAAIQPKQPDVGPVGRNLIANVERLRKARGMSYNKLSAALSEAGRPIFPLGLSRLEKAERRVDVDELVALARVLGVAPAELLEAPRDAPFDHPAVIAVRRLAGPIADLIEAAGDAQATARAGGQASRALRRAQIEVEELIAAAGGQP